MVLLLGIFLVRTLVVSVPDNAIAVSYGHRSDATNILLPQGWSFFTKNPRDLKVYVYKLGNDRIAKVDLANFSAPNYYGLNKRNRLVHHVLQKNIKNIPSAHWYPNTGLIEEVSVDCLNAYNITEGAEFLDNGVYIVQLVEPMPWYWFSQSKDISMPSKLIILNNLKYERIISECSN